MNVTTINKAASKKECDFCSCEPPAKYYPARSFRMISPPIARLNSIGDWGACSSCSELIDAGRFEELKVRALAGFERRRGRAYSEEEREALRIALDLNFEEFRKNRLVRVEEAVLVRIQNVHDYFVRNARLHDWEDIRSFFAVRPPFPKMVFSYDSEFFNQRLSGKITRHVDVVVEERSRDYFSHYFQVEANVAKAEELRALVEKVVPFRFLEFRLAIDTKLMPGRWFVMIDAAGRILTDGNLGWVFVKDPSEDAIIEAASRAEGIDVQEKVQDTFGAHGACVMAALQFMNCRNVEVVDNPPSRQQRRRAEREGRRPPVTYKTLVIHPFGRKRSTTVSSPSGVELSLHICRGHFKHYERHLDGTGGLGKAHVEGTWWWSPSVRGSAAAGRVEKDYEVEHG